MSGDTDEALTVLETAANAFARLGQAEELAEVRVPHESIRTGSGTGRVQLCAAREPPLDLARAGLAEQGDRKAEVKAKPDSCEGFAASQE